MTVLCSLHWLVVWFWAQFKVLVFTIIVLNGLEPVHLRAFFCLLHISLGMLRLATRTLL